MRLAAVCCLMLAWLLPAGAADTGIISILDKGADPTGVADSTVAIQSAFDEVYNNSVIASGANHSTNRAVFCPAGVYKTTATIYIDPPGNIRAPTPVNPQAQAYTFLGEEGLPSGQLGCVIHPQFNNAPVFIIGGGNGQLIKSINIAAANSSYCNQDPGGVGFAVWSGGSYLKFENISVQNLYKGISIGYGGDGTLADSTTIEKSVIINTCYGVYYGSGQNFINSIIDSNICGTTSIWAPLGVGVNVIGGNFACPNGGYFSTITGITGVLAFDPSASWTWSGTLPIVDPTGMPNSCSSVADCGARNRLNAFVLVTTHFGIIPLRLASWNTSTRKAIFAIVPNFYQSFGGSYGGTLLSELGALTTIYASELLTLFLGPGITVAHLHYENPGATTTVIDSTTAFGTNAAVHVSDFRFNADAFFDTLPPNDPRFLITQAFPFINLGGSDVIFDASSDPSSGLMSKESLLVTSSVASGMLTWRGTIIPRLAMRMNLSGVNGLYSGSTIPLAYPTAQSPGLGTGHFDQTPFVSPSFNDADRWRQAGWGATPQWGVRSAPYTTPCLTPAQITTLTGALPAITHSGTGAATTYTIGYPLLWGGQQYRACDWNGPTHQSLASTHQFYSYGQNLTTTNVPNLSWSHTDRSGIIYMNQEALALMFSGLNLVLTPCGAGQNFMVRDVHPALGYVTVYNANSDTNDPLVFATCSGTTIGQQPYAITTF